MSSRSRFQFLFVAAFALLSAIPVQAGWHEFVHRSMLDWHRNNAWPQPFVQVDRISSCTPFVAMAQNGMRCEFTLGAHHFSQDTNALTEAGRLKVYDILRRQPEGFNQVYVMRGHDERTSSIRLDSVQQTVAQYVSTGNMPEVLFTDFSARPVPAAHVDAISRKATATIPDPILPEFTGTTN